MRKYSWSCHGFPKDLDFAQMPIGAQNGMRSKLLLSPIKSFCNVSLDRFPLDPYLDLILSNCRSFLSYFRSYSSLIFTQVAGVKLLITMRKSWWTRRKSWIKLKCHGVSVRRQFLYIALAFSSIQA